ELGDMMDSYAHKQAVRNNEGAIGIFTNDLISRKDMFVHVVKLLRGQWEYWSYKSSESDSLLHTTHKYNLTLLMPGLQFLRLHSLYWKALLMDELMIQV